MPKYLIKVSYGTEGVRGLLKEGGVARREAVSKLVAGMGGTVEAFYFAFGEDDAYVITDVPNQVDALALTLAINATGVVRLTSTPLIDAEDIDSAAKKTVPYRAPGA